MFENDPEALKRYLELQAEYENPDSRYRRLPAPSTKSRRAVCELTRMAIYAIVHDTDGFSDLATITEKCRADEILLDPQSIREHLNMLVEIGVVRRKKSMHGRGGKHLWAIAPLNPETKTCPLCHQGLPISTHN